MGVEGSMFLPHFSDLETISAWAEPGKGQVSVQLLSGEVCSAAEAGTFSLALPLEVWLRGQQDVPGPSQQNSPDTPRSP